MIFLNDFLLLDIRLFSFFSLKNTRKESLKPKISVWKDKIGRILLSIA